MDDPGVAARYAAAVARRDLAALRQLRHPEYVARWPQSGELVRGPERIERDRTDLSGGAPQLSGVRRVDGQDDLWTIESVATYPDGSRWWWVTILELRDGLWPSRPSTSASRSRRRRGGRPTSSGSTGPLRRCRRNVTARRRPPTRAAWVTPTPRSIRERDFATLATLRARRLDLRVAAVG